MIMGGERQTERKTKTETKIGRCYTSGFEGGERNHQLRNAIAF